MFMMKTSGNLLVHLQKVRDPRRLQGQRHELSTILLITIMSIMSGYIGYRAIGDFIAKNKTDLINTLKPKKGRLPSFDVIRQVLMHIDFKELSNQFYSWSKEHVNLSKNEWVSIDGKAIGGTYNGGSTINQHFISLVTLYCSKKKLVLGNAEVVNSKESEIPIVQQLIEALDLSGVIFTLDALHCQKKQQE
jgi:hypothetical protein